MNVVNHFIKNTSRWSMRARLFFLCSILVVGTVPARTVSAQHQRDATAPIVGKLPNGLTYYIKSNSHPADRAFLWLAVNAGSIQEDDDQRGFAHFLEHMAFNGTRRFPANALIDEVERAGMRFGPDLNAYTSFDETVYQLTIPTDDSLSMQRGLQIVHDWVDGGILNDSIAVVEERGVVIGEWRARLMDSVSVNFQHDNMERIFGKGSRYLDRLPIGDTGLLANAQPSAIRRFYHDWYRPDRMAVIVVGDFDAQAMAKMITTQFGTIPKTRTQRKFTRPAPPASSKTVVQLVKHNISPEVDFSWPVIELPEDPKAAMRALLVERLTFQYLNRIARTMTRQKGHRLVASATIGRNQGPSRSLPETYQLQVIAHPDTLLRGFGAMLTEIERVSQHGISSTTLDAEKKELLRELEAEAMGDAATPSRQIAKEYVDHFLNGKGEHIWAPQEAYTLAQEILPKISEQDISAFAARWHSERGRMVWINIPRSSTLNHLTDPTVLALLDSIAKHSVVANTPFLADSSHLTQAFHGSDHTGSVQATRALPNLDATELTLSNGARVIVKPTLNNPDEVVIAAGSPGGHSLFPDSLFYSSGRLATFLLKAAAGIVGRSPNDLRNESPTTGVQDFSLELNAFNESMAVRGSPRELETLFQFIYTQWTNPTVDSAFLEEWRRNGIQKIGLSHNDFLAQRWGSNSRLGLGSKNSVMFINVEQAMRVYRDRFGDASDFTFYIVGAVDTAVVRSLAERYLATLPSTHRTAHETPKSFGIKPPMGKSEFSGYHPALLPERAIMSLVFVGDVKGASAMEQREQRWRLNALSSILGRRLRNRLREEMAVTYSVSAPVEFYYTPESRYMLTVEFIAAPEMIDSAARAVWEEIKTLQAQGPTEEEATRAAQILRRQLENSGQDNLWWAGQLMRHEFNGMTFDSMSMGIPFTAADIRDAATQYLSDKVYQQKIYRSDKLKTAAPQQKTAN